MNDSRIREQMEVIGADGVHVGTVDRVQDGRIKLTKADAGMGHHKGHHHFIDISLVAGVEDQKVRLSANAAVAVTMEKEETESSASLLTTTNDPPAESDGAYLRVGAWPPPTPDIPRG